MNVLLAIDDSEFSTAAVQSVIEKFQPSDTQVHVLHVVGPIAVSAPPQMAPGYAPELEELVKEGQKLVEAAAEKLRQAGFRVTASVEKGDPRSAIVDHAAAWPADMIVVGSHGKRGLTRFLLGSTSEAVARFAPCSVQIVRKPRSR